MKNTRMTMENLEGLMHLVYRFFSKKTSSSLYFTKDKGYTLDNLGSEPKRSSIV